MFIAMALCVRKCAIYHSTRCHGVFAIETTAKGRQGEIPAVGHEFCVNSLPVARRDVRAGARTVKIFAWTPQNPSSREIGKAYNWSFAIVHEPPRISQNRSKIPVGRKWLQIFWRLVYTLFFTPAHEAPTRRKSRHGIGHLSA